MHSQQPTAKDDRDRASLVVSVAVKFSRKLRILILNKKHRKPFCLRSRDKTEISRVQHSKDLADDEYMRYEIIQGENPAGRPLLTNETLCAYF